MDAVSELEIDPDVAVNGDAAAAGAVAGARSAAAEAVDLGDSWLYFNRELSWMD